DLKLSFLRSADRKTWSPKAASVSPLNSSAAFLFRFATSCAVRNSRPSSSFGRSNGVAALCDQMPEMSGWPSAARGGVQALAAGFAAGFAVCAPSGAARDATTTATNSAPTIFIQRWRMSPPGLLWFRGSPGRGGLVALLDPFAAERAAHRLVAFVACVLVNLVLRVLQEHHGRPRIRKRVRIVEGDLV